MTENYFFCHSDSSIDEEESLGLTKNSKLKGFLSRCPYCVSINSINMTFRQYHIILTDCLEG